MHGTQGSILYIRGTQQIFTDFHQIQILYNFQITEKSYVNFSNKINTTYFHLKWHGEHIFLFDQNIIILPKWARAGPLKATWSLCISSDGSLLAGPGAFSRSPPDQSACRVRGPAGLYWARPPALRGRSSQCEEWKRAFCESSSWMTGVTSLPRGEDRRGDSAQLDPDSGSFP